MEAERLEAKRAAEEAERERERREEAARRAAEGPKRGECISVPLVLSSASSGSFRPDSLTLFSPDRAGGTRGRARGTAGASTRGSASGAGRGASSSSYNTSAASSSFNSTSGIGRGGPPAAGRGTVTGVRGVRGLRSRVLVRGAGTSGRGRGAGE